MTITVTSVHVDDQEYAPGFVKKTDVRRAGPAGSRSHPRTTPTASAPGTRGTPASRAFRQALVADVAAETARLKGLGVRFTQEPVSMGGYSPAVFDDTCGNLIQIAGHG